MLNVKDHYGHRLQYHWPHHISRPWLPAVRWRGMSDEFCNRSIWITLPLFAGALVIFYDRKLRTYDDGLCDPCRDQWFSDTGIVYKPGMIGMSNGEPIFMERTSC